MLTTLLSAYAVFLVAVMSPGPDFAITVQNSVRYGRRAGVLTALGIALGNLAHIGYVSIGLGAVIAHSVVAFSVMKYVAAVYLAWIGFKALRSKPYAPEDAAADLTRTAGDRTTFMQGAVCAALNPKAALFWLSFFTLVISPDMPLGVLAGFVGVLFASIAAWFSIVAAVMSHKPVRARFMRFGHWFDRATGSVLIALGVKVALAEQ